MILHIIIPTIFIASQLFLNVILIRQIAKLEDEIDMINTKTKKHDL